MKPRTAQIRTLLIDLSVAVGIGVTLAFLGPFGSFQMPFPIRLAYWVLLTVGGYVIYRPVMAACEHLADRLDLPRPALWIAGCFVATVPMSLLVWLADGVHGEVRPLTFQRAANYYGNVLVIGAIVTVVYWLTHDLGQPMRRSQAEPPAGGALPARFLDRLPPGAGRDLIALEMQDHYVMAHTAAGSHLILMRMRDAVEELDGIDGAQVHRSWWVARAAVRDVTREGRNVRLILARGVEAPVARSKVTALEDAGWLS